MIANGHFIIIANIVLLCEDVLSYLILNDLQQGNNFMTKFGQNSPFSDTNCVWSLTAYSQGEWEDECDKLVPKEFNFPYVKYLHEY